MNRSLWLAFCSIVACSSNQEAVPDALAVAVRAGDWPQAYVAATSRLCVESNLDLARQTTELWDKAGRPSSPLYRLEDCSLDPGVLAYLEGMLAAARGAHAEAEAHFERASKRIGSDMELQAEIAYRRGIVLIRAEQWQSARAVLERGVALAPVRVDLRIALARATLDAVGPGPAVSEIRSVLMLSPQPDELDRARSLLVKAVQRSQPKLDARVENELELLLADLEKDALTDESRARVRTWTSRDPHPKTLTVAGLLMMKSGNLTEGSFYLERAAALNPLDPEPLRSLGSTLYAAGRTQLALPVLQRAHERDPFDVVLAKDLATAATEVDDNAVALAAYQHLAVLVPRDPDVFLWLARLRRRAGSLVEARRAARNGVALQDTSIPLVLELASIEAQLTLSAATTSERAAAAERTRRAVAALLKIAPAHPGAKPILESIE